VSYLGLLRALRLVVAAKEEVEKALYPRLVDLFGVEVDLVFYDLTSTFVEGQAKRSSRLRRGYTRDGRGDCKQIVIGLVVTREGFPLTCHVFDGNTLDKATLARMVKDLRHRFEVHRCIWVSDTGLLSAANLKMLQESGYDFILGAGNGSRKDVGEAVEQTRRAPDAVLKDVQLWDVPVGEAGRHIVIVESEGRQAKTCAILERRLRRVRERFGALARQAVHGKGLGREALLIEAEKALQGSGVSKYFTYEAQDRQFTWREDVAAVAARCADAGKYGLLTNTALGAEEVLSAYRTLLVVEDAFRVLKNELDLRPLWHRQDVQIEGHVLLAMWSYLLHKTVEVQLQRAGIAISTADALEAVGEVRAVEVAVREKAVWKLMHMRPEAEQVLHAVGIAHVKAAFKEWAEQAPPYRYELRKVPWPGASPQTLDI
jgi:transposase